ncbi:MAG: esterase-like activity of phytase family protein [Cyanobacteria bacterium J06632_22]
MPNSERADVDLRGIAAAQQRRTLSQIELLGEAQIPTGTVFTQLSSQGFTQNQTEIGGLSGLAYDSNRNLYYALSDDRSSEARFYTVDGLAGGLSLKQLSLSQQNGNTTLSTSTAALKVAGRHQPDRCRFCRGDFATFDAAERSHFWLGCDRTLLSV